MHICVCVYIYIYICMYLVSSDDLEKMCKKNEQSPIRRDKKGRNKYS